MPRVLIVEDEELLSNAFRIILEKDGHKVEVAENGAVALDVAPDFKPDVILLDLLMPKMGGLEFLEKYQHLLKKSKLSVVVLSNLQNQEKINKAKALGAKQYLVKSQVSPSALSKLVKELLEAA